MLWAVMALARLYYLGRRRSMPSKLVSHPPRNPQ